MKNTSFILAVIQGMTLALSCEKDGGGKDGTYTPAKPITLTKSQEKIVSSSNDFAFRMFAELEDKLPATQSMFYSPFSLAMALAMTSCGAGGNTLQQIKDVLGYGEFSGEEMNESYRSLTRSLLAADPSTTIAIANSVWLDEQFPVKKGFVSDCAEYYSAKAQALPVARAALRQWRILHGRAASSRRRRLPELREDIHRRTLERTVRAIEQDNG